jgi:hypothetical protein
MKSAAAAATSAAFAWWTLLWLAANVALHWGLRWVGVRVYRRHEPFIYNLPNPTHTTRIVTHAPGAC